MYMCATEQTKRHRPFSLLPIQSHLPTFMLTDQGTPTCVCNGYICKSPSPPSFILHCGVNDQVLFPFTAQVLKLLECMSLSQYQEAFLKEQINGEILSECDETMLQNDLGVVSKLHRMRLIKVISGRHSAKSLLDGGDPYAGRFVSIR